MISELQREELEQIKPPKYREKVRAYLLKNGHTFSLETIQKVYSGKRNNIIVAQAIIAVFKNYYQKKDFINEEISTLIKKKNKES